MFWLELGEYCKWTCSCKLTYSQ